MQRPKVGWHPHALTNQPSVVAQSRLNKNRRFPEKGKVVSTLELRKQISIFVPLSDWRAIRYEAARRKIPMTELCRRWMTPELSRLRNAESKQSPE